MTKRILSVILVVSLIFSGLVFSPAVSALETLEHDDFVSVYGAHLNYDSKITPEGDGKYTIEIDMYSTYSLKEENLNVLASKDDYYVADREGKYLVELWGGDGASSVGTGGEGGYVYGIVDLKIGDTLYYTLGSAGGVTNSANNGGGANGGGGYGENGSTSVGGGGGYSALYLFGKDDFKNKYLDEDGHIKSQLAESDRTSKYIMIAAGGGGGGGYGADSDGTADGGAGGHMQSAFGTLDESYDVAGTFFSGGNGKSTGTSTNYVGRGGTNVPGATVGTILNSGKSDQPNDWRGTYNKNLPGGSGGAGNYRGGSGGGGFCGGSGGIVSSVVFATNVGGGGGGSSFVAAKCETSLGEYESLLLGRGADDANGQIHLVYLGESDDEYLGDMTISFARTPYFLFDDIKAIGQKWDEKSQSYIETDYVNDDKVNEDGSVEKYIKYDYVNFEPGIDVIRFAISNVSLMPDNDGEQRDHFKLTLRVMPKPDFGGGNNVPILMGDKITCTPAQVDENYQPVDLMFKNYCGYLNIPLNFDVSPVNHTAQGLDPENIEHPANSLYKDLYAEVRENPSADWRYRFIESISEHKIVDEWKNDVQTDSKISPDETTRYFISLTATPKAVEGKVYARFGSPVKETTFTDISVVTIAGTGMDTINGNVLVYSKKLFFEDVVRNNENKSIYKLELQVSSDSSGTIADSSVELPGFSPVNSDNNQSKEMVTLALTGKYTITLKGGNGGKGGNSSLEVIGQKGGAGGNGATISATFLLKAGTRLHFSAGASGQEAQSTRVGGAGGECSYVAVVDEHENVVQYLIIAAGGGGGGGAWIWNAGKPGTDASGDNPTQSASPNDLLSYNGGSGEEGTIGGGGAAGGASKSYVYNGQKDDKDFGYLVSLNEDSSNLSSTGGSGTLTRDSIGEAIGGGNEAALGKYTIDTYISKYFDVVGAELVQGEKVTALTVDKTEINDVNDKRFYTKTSVDIQVEPELLENTETNLATDNKIYKVEFTFRLILEPRAGFLGGNDVMLIQAIDTDIKTGMRISQPTVSDKEFINIDESREYDYANVKIPEKLLDSIDITTQDKVYIVGKDPVIKNTLVKSLTGLDTLLEGCSWEDDYIELVDPTKDNTELTPEVTQKYPIDVGVAPLYSSPMAKVRGTVTPLLKDSVFATVFTEAEVTFDLEGIDVVSPTPDANGRYLIVFNEYGEVEDDYVFTLKTQDLGPDHHHHMPNEMTVTVGDKTLVEGAYDDENSEYEYKRHDAENATVTIKAKSITGNVNVTVKACHEFVTLYYVYQNAPESTKTTSFELTRHFGDKIDLAADFAEAGKTLPAEVDHYKFVWDNDGDEATPIVETMPKQNVWMIGRYVPETYDITVTYVIDDGKATAPVPITQTVSYNENYSIVSPKVEGYSPDVDIISGKAIKDDSFTVTYKATPRQLKIICLYADGTPVTARNEYFKNGDGIYTGEFDLDEEYSITLPSVVGYLPEKSVVIGKMTEEGLTEYVYYNAQKYTVSFSFDAENGGSCSVSEKTVEYGKTYGYNAATDKYDGLPTPIKVGYTFIGWELNGNKVTENTKVTATTDQVLVAKWEGMEFTLTINYYLNSDENEPFSTLTKRYEFGGEYSHDSPSVTGYSTNTPTVSGIMPAQNTVINVVYQPNTYTVTVKFVYADDNNTQAAETKEVEKKHGEEYSIPIPELVGYYTSYNGNEVKGIINAANVNVVVYYYEDAPNMDFEIEWSSMSFVYNKGKWNPSELRYEGGYFYAVDDSNMVSVTNKPTSNISIITEFEYVSDAKYANIHGYFTDRNDKDSSEITSLELGVNESVAAYLHLDGEFSERDSDKTYTVGTCTVNIHGGTKEVTK